MPTGHIEKRSKKGYTIVLDFGWSPILKKRDRRYIPFQGNSREAEAELRRLIVKAEQGLFVDPSKFTVAEYLLKWLEDYGRSNLAPLTFESYERIIKKHIIPAMGMTPLQKLQPLHLQEYYTKALKEGRCVAEVNPETVEMVRLRQEDPKKWSLRALGKRYNISKSSVSKRLKNYEKSKNPEKKGLSKRTVQYHHRILFEALKHAVGWRLIPINPAEAVSPPKPPKPKISIPDLPDIDRFIIEAQDHPDYPIWFTALNTGMRISEVLGLTWTLIDLEKKIIKVEWALKVIKESDLVNSPDCKKLCVLKKKKASTPTKWMVLDVPKQHSIRTVTIPNVLVSMLREHRQKQLEARMSFEGTYQDYGLVFARYDGSPDIPGNVTKRFKNFVDKIGLSGVRFHDQRHIHASLLLAEGASTRGVQERLGHSTVVQTEGYTHVVPKLQQELAEKCENLFGRRFGDGKQK